MEQAPCLPTTKGNEIAEAAPKGYENRVRRDGTLNAFDDPAFAAAVAAPGGGT